MIRKNGRTQHQQQQRLCMLEGQQNQFYRGSYIKKNEDNNNKKGQGGGKVVAGKGVGKGKKEGEKGTLETARFQVKRILNWLAASTPSKGLISYPFFLPVFAPFLPLPSFPLSFHVGFVSTVFIFQITISKKALIPTYPSNLFHDSISLATS